MGIKAPFWLLFGFLYQYLPSALLTIFRLLHKRVLLPAVQLVPNLVRGHCNTLSGLTCRDGIFRLSTDA